MVFVCLDTETTGLDPKSHCLWQISGVVRCDGQGEEFDFKMKPFEGEPMSMGAFVKTGMTQEVLDTYPDQKGAFDAFNALLQKYLYMPDGTHRKAVLIGYNVQFDVEFIQRWFAFNSHPHLFRSYFHYPWMDVMTLSLFYLMGERASMPNFKLTTVYEKVFEEQFDNAHDGACDAMATWRLFVKISNDLTKVRLENAERIG